MSTHDEDELEASLTNDLKHTLKLVPSSQRELFVFELAKYLTSRDQSIKEQARRVAKQESAHDFDNIVKAYNLAIESKFDRLSVTRLYFAINGADNRAKYIDLPEQTALHSTNKIPEEK